MLGYLVGTAAVFGIGAVGYQSMAPSGQWFGRTFTGLSTDERTLALTYDDGPNDPHTLHLLDVLARHDVRATFFMIGRFVRQRPEIARAVAKAGHAVGNHTFTHPNLAFQPSVQTRIQIEECERALTDIVGEHTNLFRPPYGGRRPLSLRMARSLGLEPIMWNVIAWDWNAPSVEYIERKVTKGVHGGNVIVMHDGGHRGMGADRSRTVTATDRLIARYKAEGYSFVTIPQMMGKLVPQTALIRQD